MATIRDVAESAGVGIGTVSRALSGNGYVASDKMKKIMEAVEVLEYKVPKRQQKAAEHDERIIGVIVPDVSIPFYGSFLKYVEIELSNQGYKTMIYNTLGIQGRVSEAVELAERGILSGLIVNADVTREECLRLEKLPVVSFERLFGKQIPFVSSKHREGGRKVGELLYENRCMNVLIITARHITGVYGDYRIGECKEYLEQRGVKVNIVEYPASNSTMHFANEMARQYMDMYHTVDGIFSDDIVAYCCLQNAIQRKIDVPRNLKIVGYDGNELTGLSIPKLTTVRQDIPQIARICVTVLKKRVAGEKVEKEYFIPVLMDKGGTTN